LWTASATTSLPTPLSPSINSGTRARAALAAMASADRNCGAAPTISSNASGIDSFSVSGRNSPALFSPIAASSAASRRSAAIGLTRKSLAPARIASTACATEPSAVRIRIGSAGRLARNSAISAAESQSPAQLSSTTASSAMPSGVPSIATAISGSPANTVRHPRRAAMAATRRRCAGSSSMSMRRRWPLRIIAFFCPQCPGFEHGCYRARVKMRLSGRLRRAGGTFVRLRPASPPGHPTAVSYGWPGGEAGRNRNGNAPCRAFFYQPAKPSDVAGGLRRGYARR
jgi:hypothetical protein